jgi:hypothetical protein
MAKDESKNDDTNDAAAAPPRRSMLGKLIVLGIVAAVVASECALAYWFLPVASETPAAAASVPPKHSPAAPAKTTEREAKSEPAPSDETERPANAEVDLTEFTVTIFKPAANSTLRVDFHLWGSVAAESQKEFQKLFDENKNRFREQVRIAISSAEMSDLNDPSLSLIKRTILDKARTIIGKPLLLQDVIISDFSFIEQ